MPDIQYRAATVSATRPVFSGRSRTMAADRIDDRVSDIDLLDGIRQISPAKVATILSFAILCWTPIAAILVDLLR
ncbi:hypothetical protein [Sphingomonas sanguinis]|uniref:hypothetical protein n=1 Tax=Sphingomonas sanguinis TaxID=33051 RepID=UPI0007365E28|nr:hypothetical protein [Sphingomonas sanguinis]